MRCFLMQQSWISTVDYWAVIGGNENGTKGSKGQVVVRYRTGPWVLVGTLDVPECCISGKYFVYIQAPMLAS